MSERRSFACSSYSGEEEGEDDGKDQAVEGEPTGEMFDDVFILCLSHGLLLHPSHDDANVKGHEYNEND